LFSRTKKKGGKKKRKRSKLEEREGSLKSMRGVNLPWGKKRTLPFT